MIKILALSRSNSSYILADKVIKSLSSLIVISLVARELGVSLFGEFNSLLSIAAFLVPIASLGLNKIVVKAMSEAEAPRKKDLILSTSIIMRFLIGLILSLLAHFYFKNFAFTFFLFCQSFLALQLCELALNYEDKFKAICKLRSLLTIIFAIAKCVLVFKYPSISTMLFVFGLEVLTVELMLFIVFLCGSERKFRLQVKPNELVSLLKKSSLLMLSATFSVVYLKLDIVMLENMHSAYEAGVYSAASKVSEAWLFIPTVLLARYFPTQLKIYKFDKELYKKSLQFMMDKTLLLALIFVVFILIFGEMIIQTLYGDKYLDSVQILQLHCIASVFIALRLLVSQWLIIHDQYLMSLYSHVIGALVNVVLNYLLIPTHGGIGAVIATISAYMVASYLSLFVNSATYEIRRVMGLSFAFVFRFKSFLQLEKPWSKINIKL